MRMRVVHCSARNASDESALKSRLLPASSAANAHIDTDAKVVRDPRRLVKLDGRAHRLQRRRVPHIVEPLVIRRARGSPIGSNGGRE